MWTVQCASGAAAENSSGTAQLLVLPAPDATGSPTLRLGCFLRRLSGARRCVQRDHSLYGEWALPMSAAHASHFSFCPVLFAPRLCGDCYHRLFTLTAKTCGVIRCERGQGFTHIRCRFFPITPCELAPFHQDEFCLQKTQHIV